MSSKTTAISRRFYIRINYMQIRPLHAHLIYFRPIAGVTPTLSCKLYSAAIASYVPGIMRKRNLHFFLAPDLSRTSARLNCYKQPAMQLKRGCSSLTIT